MRSNPQYSSRCLAVAIASLVIGCGDLGCPDAFVNASGVCVPFVEDDGRNEPEPRPDDEPDPPPGTERCDGVDNDGDMQVDENYPSLGEACGSNEGECVAGVFVCAEDGRGVVCDGATEPTAEICDGLDNDCDGVMDNGPTEICDGEDNDCDGLIDEGALAVKKESPFGGLTSIAAVPGGFVATRITTTQILLETYDTSGNRTGNFYNENIAIEPRFVESDVSGASIVILWGDRRFFAAEGDVDDDLIPRIFDTRELNTAWNSGDFLSTSTPPFHARISASTRRVVGYDGLFEFQVAPFDDDLEMVEDPPVFVPEIPGPVSFETTNAWMVWENGDTLRGGLVLDGGLLSLDIDIGRGKAPSVAQSSGALGVASVLGDDVQLAELNGLSLQCSTGKFCNELIDADDLFRPAEGPTDLAYHADLDLWFVAAGDQIVAIGRSGQDPYVHQIEQRADLPQLPNRIEVVVSGGTAAVMQSTENGDSVLTFLGCF